MLSSAKDELSLLYLMLFPFLGFWQWFNGFSIILYLVMLLISVGLGVIHHNHTHLPMWRVARLNRITDLYLSALQAVPTFVFFLSHIQNHHRYRHGVQDETRTYRFGGDHNHLWGYLTHPFLALGVLLPVFFRKICSLRQQSPQSFYFALLQVGVGPLLWGLLMAADWRKFLIVWFIPQMHGVHWLLGANYLQHAHADGHSNLNYARNFTGWINVFWFNIGYHTAHHENPSAHWSELPPLHEKYVQDIDRRLVEPSFTLYVIRVFFLSLFWLPFRSRTFMGRPGSFFFK